MPRGRSTIALQDLINAGLNGFAIQLVAESMNGHHQKELLRKPLSFAFDEVIFTISLMPEREWTAEALAEAFRPVAELADEDTFLARFARAFVGADREEQRFLTHYALILIDKYNLWPPAAADRPNPEGDSHAVTPA